MSLCAYDFTAPFVFTSFDNPNGDVTLVEKLFDNEACLQ